MYQKLMCTDEEFVQLWQKMPPKDLAGKLEVTVPTVCARAYRLRKNGIKLKKYPPGYQAKPKPNRKHLNQLIKELS